MDCRQGAARRIPFMGLQPSRNAAASPFSTQPFRAVALWRFSCVARLTEIAADIGASLAPWRIAKSSTAIVILFPGQDTSCSNFMFEGKLGWRRQLLRSNVLLPGEQLLKTRIVADWVPDWIEP
jgi:hypothetical protein